MNFGGIFDVDRKARRLEEVNREIENPDLWNDPKHAQEVSKEKKMLDDIVGSFNRLTQGIADDDMIVPMRANSLNFLWPKRISIPSKSSERM